ncbi:MAG: DUF1501 domain-containing protein [Myxococcales bacterium]|nr:DUF1501 domain-containing protein [Myxococcales bacterium]
MDRRSFLKFTAASGVALMSPLGIEGSARAAAATYGGPYFLLIHASGGWDPTLACDPKGSDGPVRINATFTRGQIGQAGNIRYAPISATIGGNPYGPQQFFTKYQNRLYIINGIDTTTGNHDTGTRAIWSGQVTDGFPSFAAVVAAAKTPDNPLGFIANGGYETTAGLTSLTRLGNVDSVQRIAYANRIDPANPMNTYHTNATWDRINMMQRERLDDLRKRQTLPRLSRSAGELYLARSTDNTLPQLAAALPSQAMINAATNGLHRQAMVALAGFKTGLAVAASISTGGFDTHGNHDNSHQPLMCNFLYGIDMIMQEITNQGLDGKVVVCVGSDFGRTPGYNAQQGKDHWNITSMLFMGPGISGGKVVGSTDDGQKANKVNPSTLQPDPNGTRIRCEHIQNALRKLAGVADSSAARKFPIAATEEMPLFT